MVPTSPRVEMAQRVLHRRQVAGRSQGCAGLPAGRSAVPRFQQRAKRRRERRNRHGLQVEPLIPAIDAAVMQPGRRGDTVLAVGLGLDA